MSNKGKKAAARALCCTVEVEVQKLNLNSSNHLNIKASDSQQGDMVKEIDRIFGKLIAVFKHRLLILADEKKNDMKVSDWLHEVTDCYTAQELFKKAKTDEIKIKLKDIRKEFDVHVAKLYSALQHAEKEKVNIYDFSAIKAYPFHCREILLLETHNGVAATMEYLAFYCS